MLTRRTSQAAVPVPAQIASTEQSPETNSDPIGTISTSGEVARRLHHQTVTKPRSFPSLLIVLYAAWSGQVVANAVFARKSWRGH
jgi:hypothetical protein